MLHRETEYKNRFIKWEFKEYDLVKMLLVLGLKFKTFMTPVSFNTNDDHIAQVFYT